MGPLKQTQCVCLLLVTWRSNKEQQPESDMKRSLITEPVSTETVPAVLRKQRPALRGKSLGLLFLLSKRPANDSFSRFVRVH